MRDRLLSCIILIASSTASVQAEQGVIELEVGPDKFEKPQNLDHFVIPFLRTFRIDIWPGSWGSHSLPPNVTDCVIIPNPSAQFILAAKIRFHVA